MNAPECRKWMLRADPTHTLFCIERGNTGQRLATLFLHGGPGGTLSEQLLSLVPDGDRAVAFDQRGCGRSRPSRSVEANTTWHSVDDIEQLRRSLDVDSFRIVAGSWGSALALIYAARHRRHVHDMLLYSPFLGTRTEADHFLMSSRDALPDAWRAAFGDIRSPSPDRIIAHFNRLVMGPAGLEQSEACRKWVEYELQVSTLGAETELDRALLQSGFHLTYARISCHYFANRFFLEADSCLEMAKSLDLPVTLLQGDRDLVSHPQTVERLAGMLPRSRLRMIAGAGHCGGAPELDAQLEALIAKGVDDF